MQKIKSALPSLISLALAAGMVAAAELLHEKEIIFPEITAIAIGALAAPRQVWNTSRLRLLLTITACAAAGVGVVWLVPLPLAAQIPIGLILAFALITASGTEFLPAVSACVLPVLLGTRSPVYILSVIVMICHFITPPFLSGWIVFLSSNQKSLFFESLHFRFP